MSDLPGPYMLLSILCGLFWTAAYILIIRRGFIDKTSGMPFFALALNISWEFIYSFITPAPGFQRYINILWLVLDSVILYQFIRFWKKDYAFIPNKWVAPLFGLVMATAFFGVLLVQVDSTPIEGFPLGMGRAYSAFGMNIVMSILFVVLFFRRNSLAGQSIYIALAKLIGTLFMELSFLFYPQLPGVPDANVWLFPYAYLVILVWDGMYVFLIYQKCRQQFINPWKRI